MANPSFLKNFLTFGVGKILYTLVTLLLVPLYLERINIADYGILSISLVTVNLFAIVFSFSISNGILRAFNDSDDSLKQTKNIFSTTVIFYIVLSFLVYLSSKLFGTHLSSLIFGNEKFISFVDILILISITRVFVNIFNGFFLAKNYTIKYVIMNLFGVLSLALINIYQIFYTDYSLYSIIQGYFYSGLLTIVLGFIFSIKAFSFNFDFNIVRFILKYGIPLGVASLISYFINYGNRYFIINILDESSVAIIDVAQKIGGLIGLLLTGAFITTFTPYYLRLYKEVSFSTFNKKINEIIFTYSLSFFFFSLVVVMYQELFLSLLSNEEYMDSAIFVPYILLSDYFHVLFMMLTLGTNIKKETKYEMYITIIILVVSVFLNVFLINLFSLYGAVFVQISINILSVFLISYYNSKRFNININFPKLLKLVIVFIILVSIKLVFDNYFDINSILLSKLVMPSSLIIIFVISYIKSFSYIKNYVLNIVKK